MQATARHVEGYGHADASTCPNTIAEMIQPEDILKTIRYLLGLSGAVCVKEIVLEMRKSIL